LGLFLSDLDHLIDDAFALLNVNLHVIIVTMTYVDLVQQILKTLEYIHNATVKHIQQKLQELERFLLV
jgi:hypothetical protein